SFYNFGRVQILDHNEKEKPGDDTWTTNKPIEFMNEWIQWIRMSINLNKTSHHIISTLSSSNLIPVFSKDCVCEEEEEEEKYKKHLHSVNNILFIDIF
ncbi:hypothetical protein DERF_008864, partial [Dermatophagoides farinae]